MAHIERSERAGRQGHWRRKQHRWNGPDHFHNDSRGPVFQNYDGLGAPGSFKIPSRPVPSVGRQDGHMLDELTLKHMAQDCSSLKNQLLRLKTLLQLEDPGSPADVVEESEDCTTALQLEELMKEVRVLREELRSRDKTIAQLTLQCQQLQQQQQREQTPTPGRHYRCQCGHQRASSSLRQSDRQMDRRTHQHYDKATQTHWRAPNYAPQILQPSNHCLNEHLQQERLVKTPPTEGHSEPRRRSSREGGAHKYADPLPEDLTADGTGPAGPLAPDPDELNCVLSAHLHRLGSGASQGGTARHHPASAAQSVADLESRAPVVTLQDCGAPTPAGSTCPRMLQPPRFHKRVSVPALKPGGPGGSAPLKSGGSLGLLANLRTKQLPPPTRGLPCFNAGPQAQVPSSAHTSLLQPRTQSGPRRDPQRSKTAAANPSLEELRDPGAARILIPSIRSCLPKPKIP